MNRDKVKVAQIEVCETAKKMSSSGLVAGTWGNISARVDDEYMVITPSGMDYDRLFPEDMVLVNMKTFEYEGKLKPSVEVPVHAAVYLDRETVNGIIHPMVWEEVRRRLRRAGEEGASLAVVEAALPGEKVHDIYDEMWYVYTSRENRIRRLMEGRGYTREKCESIMASQLSDEAFRRLCDFEIDNNGSLEEVKEQIRSRLENRGFTT